MPRPRPKTTSSAQLSTADVGERQQILYWVFCVRLRLATVGQFKQAPPHPTNVRKSSTNELWEQVCHDIRDCGQRDWSQKVSMLRSGAGVQRSPGAAKTSVYLLMGTFCYRANKSSSSSQRGLWKPSEDTCFLRLTQRRQGMTIFLLCALVCVARAFLETN